MSLRQRLETIHIQSPPGGWVGTSVILAPVPGHRIAVYSAVLSLHTTGAWFFANDDGTAISGVQNFPADTPIVLPIQQNMDPWFITKPNAGLNIIVTTAGDDLFGDLYVMQVPN